MKKLIVLLLLTISLQSFSQKLKIRFTSPAFQKGGWIIPTSTFIGSAYFAAKAIKANNTTYSEGKNSYKNTGDAYALYSAALLVASFTITISMQSDK